MAQMYTRLGEHRLAAMSTVVDTLERLELIPHQYNESEASWAARKAVHHCRSLLERALDDLAREEEGQPTSTKSLLEDLRRLEVR